MCFLHKFKKIFGVMAAFALLGNGVASADSADDLAATLKSGVYYIEYENVSPLNQRKLPKEKTSLIQSGSLYSVVTSDFSDPYLKYKLVSGIATSDGRNQYNEYSSVEADTKDEATGKINDGFQYTDCALVRGDEIFFYKRLKNKKGKMEYYAGGFKNKVTAQKALYNNLGHKLTLFGDGAVTMLLNALMPNELKPEGSLVFQKVNRGVSFSGLEFVDYKATNLPADSDVFLNAIRYYFDIGKLVKIYSGVYTRKNGVVDGTRTIVNIKTFEAKARRSLLTLPAELKDVTKRKD